MPTLIQRPICCGKEMSTVTTTLDYVCSDCGSRVTLQEQHAATLGPSPKYETIDLAAPWEGIE